MSCILTRKFNFKSTIDGEVYTFVVTWNEVANKIYAQDIETPRGHAGFAIPLPSSLIKDIFIAIQMVEADTFADSYTGIPAISGTVPGPSFICMS